MTGRQFKDLFAAIAKQSGWNRLGNGWVFPQRDCDECAVTISLQQASHEKTMYVNIGVYVDGISGYRLQDRAHLEGTQAHVFRREPQHMSHVLNFSTTISDEQRTQELVTLFTFLNDFATKATTRLGLLDLEKHKEVFIISPVRYELERPEADRQ